jgi:hypothetical protein
MPSLEVKVRCRASDTSCEVTATDSGGNPDVDKDVVTNKEGRYFVKDYTLDEDTYTVKADIGPRTDSDDVVLNSDDSVTLSPS